MAIKCKKKNLWRRNCVRRAISERRSTRQGSSYTKNEYSLFYQKFDGEYFLFNNLFEKSCIFRENRKKLFWGRI